MPLIIRTDEQKAAGRAALDPHFATLLTDKGVSEEIRGILGSVGMVQSSHLANFGGDDEKVRTRLENALGITDTDDIALQMQMSHLIETWRAARGRIQAHDDAQAEARAAGRAREIPPDEGLSMRTQHERAHGELDDADFPCRDYIAWRIGQFETGVLRSETLDQVVSYELAGDDKTEPAVALQWTPGSRSLMAIRKPAVAPIPKTTEQLRACYALMKVHWQVIRLRYPCRYYFVNYRDEIWEEQVNYFLGKKIYQYEARGGHSLHWDDLLEYMYQVRKSAYKRVSKERMSLVEAFTAALHCPLLKQEYFTLQLTTSGVKRSTKESESAAGSSGDPASKRSREFEQELNKVKKLRQQLEQQARQGKAALKGAGRGKSQPTVAEDPPFVLASAARNLSAAQQTAKNKYAMIRKTEKLHLRLEGSNQMVCNFFQWGGCRNTDADCGFAHVCARCQQTGHGCADGRCKATPRKK